MPAPRRRWPPARMGRAHAAADAQHRNARADVLQPRDRRHRQGPPGARKSTRWAARWRSPPTRPASSSGCSTPARVPPCGRRARRPTACSTGARSAAGSRTSRISTLFQQAVDDLLLDGDRVVRRRHADRPRVSRRRGRAHDRHVPERLDPRRPAELRGGPGGRPAGQAPGARGCASCKLPVGRLKTGTPPRLDGRTIDFTVLAVQPGDDPEPVFSFLARRALHPRAAALLDHAHERAHARDHPRRPRPLADVRGRHPRRRPALLPVDRGQGRAVRRSATPPDLPRAGGPRHARDLSERHLDAPAGRRAAGDGPLDPRAASTRTSCGPATRSSTTTSSARAAPDARDQGDRAASSSPARSTARPGYEEAAAQGLLAGVNAARARRDEALVPAPRRGVPRRAGRRPGHARRVGAVPDVHVARGVPAARCARTTPTCG